MFIPRKVAEAKPLGLSTAQAEDLANRFRARFLAPFSDGDIMKLLPKMGGRWTTIAVIDRREGQDDLLLAITKDNFTISTIDYGAVMDDGPNRRIDVARAIGHMFLHHPQHIETHGASVAMVVPRYPEADDEEGLSLHREAAWFARELLAPAATVAAVTNKNSRADVATIAILVSQELRVSRKIAAIQIRRAGDLGLINRNLEGTA
ncbi:hypothetical protein JKP88DRAFT_290674 [Tribonema minus]|uniref:IrrE N-terminal-like domain-containing protein n=1 Tax=Tribonema minus TaxID=303371 RepID=A0A835YYZ3_9STRA|nr:hypothetical protein JKP88DRAFT_290674 [Tribonema minus]